MNSPPFRRIVITVPPRDWFHGIEWELFVIYRRALSDLGCQLFEVPVDAFLPPDVGRIGALLTDLRAFGPDLAIGLPTGMYALLCRLPPKRDGWKPNLFTDVLEIPTICIWAFAPIDFADQLLAPHPAAPSESKDGAAAALQRHLTHPLLMHCSRDSWQTRIMQALGFALPNQIVLMGSPALPGFVPGAISSTAAGADEPRVAFIGNLYQDMPTYAEAALHGLQQDSINQWLTDNSSSLWDVVIDHIGALPAELRQRLALVQNQTFFWHFVHQLIVYHGQTIKRLHLLAAIGRPIAFYGNFRQNAPGVPPNLWARTERFRFGPELAAGFARFPITLNVTNPGFVNGYSYNPILTFAAGGFALVDRKQDLIDSFGDVGEAVSYRSAEDLAAKVDRYLTNPRERLSLGDAMRAEIRANHSLGTVLRRILQCAAQRFLGDFDRQTERASWEKRSHPASVLMNLMPTLRTHSHWLDACVEHIAGQAIVTTAAEPWAYAAEIPIAPLAPTPGELYVRLSLVVEVGRIGICVTRTETGALISEQIASATGNAISMTVEVPENIGITLIFRNTVKQRTRVALIEACLCATHNHE